MGKIKFPFLHGGFGPESRGSEGDVTLNYRVQLPD